MPVSSALSRVFLGVVITVAAVLIVIVACSRPSSPQQNQLMLLSAEEGETALIKSSVPSAPALEDPASLVATIDAAAEVLRPAPEPESAPAPTAAPQLLPESDQPPPTEVESAPRENLTDVESQTAATPDAPVAKEQPPVPAPAPASEIPREVELASASQSGLNETDAGSPQQEPVAVPQEKAGTGQNQGVDAKPSAQPEPLQRLSREFARRRAAKEGEHESTTEISLAPLPVFLPTVSMSQEHRQSCLVFVGDEMPDGLPVDSDGKEHSVRQSLGKQHTVVVLWDAANPYALDQFQELAHDLAPFTRQGVAAIAIHVGPAPENYQQLCQEFGQDTLCLLDPQQNYFAKLAQKKLPRTYVLDAKGGIVWLDIEYSRTTRYELHNVLQFCLQKTD